VTFLDISISALQRQSGKNLEDTRKYLNELQIYTPTVARMSPRYIEKISLKGIVAIARVYSEICLELYSLSWQVQMLQISLSTAKKAIFQFVKKNPQK
jgi:hypothetical protein